MKTGILNYSGSRWRRGGAAVWLAGTCIFGAVAPGVVPARAQETAPKPAIIASVNGKELTEAEFHRLCEQYVSGVANTAVGQVVLGEWIQHVVAEEEATRKKLLPTPQDIERRITSLRKQFELQGEDFNEWLAVRGRTLETLREKTRRELIVENLLTEGVVVSDAEVALYYANNKSTLGIPEQIKVSRLTVDKKEELKEVERSLKEGGRFETLARIHSIDPYKDRSGSIPTPVDADPRADGPLEKEVLERALKLEPKKVSEPIKVRDYWVFVRVDARFAAKVPELTDIQDLLTANLKIQKGGPDRLRSAKARLALLQREAKIEILRPEYKRLLTVLQSGE